MSEHKRNDLLFFTIGIGFGLTAFSAVLALLCSHGVVKLELPDFDIANIFQIKANKASLARDINHAELYDIEEENLHSDAAKAHADLDSNMNSLTLADNSNAAAQNITYNVTLKRKLLKMDKSTDTSELEIEQPANDLIQSIYKSVLAKNSEFARTFDEKRKQYSLENGNFDVFKVVQLKTTVENTCFFEAALQMLLASKEYCDHIVRTVYDPEKQPISTALKKFLTKIQESEGTFDATEAYNEIFGAFIAVHTTNKIGQQCDAAEFHHFYMNKLADEELEFIQDSYYFNAANTPDSAHPQDNTEKSTEAINTEQKESSSAKVSIPAPSKVLAFDILIGANKIVKTVDDLLKDANRPLADDITDSSASQNNENEDLRAPSNHDSGEKAAQAGIEKSIATESSGHAKNDVENALIPSSHADNTSNNILNDENTQNLDPNQIKSSQDDSIVTQEPTNIDTLEHENSSNLSSTPDNHTNANMSNIPEIKTQTDKTEQPITSETPVKTENATISNNEKDENTSHESRKTEKTPPESLNANAENSTKQSCEPERVYGKYVLINISRATNYAENSHKKLFFYIGDEINLNGQIYLPKLILCYNGAVNKGNGGAHYQSVLFTKDESFLIDSFQKNTVETKKAYGKALHQAVSILYERMDT